jgi:hypothetical protein
MWRHMLLQFPAADAGGRAAGGRAAPARAWPPWRAGMPTASPAWWRWRVLAVLMVPRVLDLALRRPDIEAAKLAALLLAGRCAAPVVAPAGLVVQGFFLGNLLPMMAVVGQLYIDSPLRLCNAYLLDDQARLGQWLIGGAAVLLALAWLAWTGWVLAGRQTPPAPAGMTAQNPPR